MNILGFLGELTSTIVREPSKMWSPLALVHVTLLVMFALLSTGTVGLVSYGYKVVSVTEMPGGTGLQAFLTPVNAGNYYGDDVQMLVVSASYETADRLHVHITDANNSRYEVPETLIPRGSNSQLPSSSSNLAFSFTLDPFGFAITRVSNGEVLFNSTPAQDGQFGSIVFKDQYLEFSTQLHLNASLFGLGEQTRPAGIQLTRNKLYTLWNTDIGASSTDVDLYGSYPYYLDVRGGGSTHGVLLLNSNGMDIYYGPNYITFKVLGGVLDFYFFAGPSPLSVTDQFTNFIGRPAPMPYWAFGFHQCRWGYKNVEALQGVVANYIQANIPLEAIWSDIDHMDAYKDFSLDPVNYPQEKLQAFLDQLHADNQHYVLIVDPGVHIDQSYKSYSRGIEADIFVKEQSGKRFIGQVWPGAVHFPDFLHPDIELYWTKEITDFHNIVDFDGLWIDMNEASNFCSGTGCTWNGETPTFGNDISAITTCYLQCPNNAQDKWNSPPYWIDASGNFIRIDTRTIGMSVKHANGMLEYDVHNLYGLSEAIITNKALISTLKKRPFVLTRSTFVGSGAYAAHWTGDNAATYSDLAYSVVSILNSGLLGVPVVGADICGFSGNTTEELCNRWIQLGAFYPFSRNHANIQSIPHELYVYPSVAVTSKKVLGLRYELLPFYYTLMYDAHMTGAPIARPLFFVFPEDPNTLGINTQFLLGSSILISPVLSQGTTYVNAYFPAGTWYNLCSYSQNISVASGSYQTLQAPLDTINIHVRAGSIIPKQEAALTTTAARKTPFTLLAAFSESSQSASGSLFLDDGEQIAMVLQNGTSTYVSFTATLSSSQGSSSVVSKVSNGEFASKQGWTVQTLILLGVQPAPTNLTINGQTTSTAVKISVDATVPLVQISGLNLLVGENFTVAW